MVFAWRFSEIVPWYMVPQWYFQVPETALVVIVWYLKHPWASHDEHFESPSEGQLVPVAPLPLLHEHRFKLQLSLDK